MAEQKKRRTGWGYVHGLDGRASGRKAHYFDEEGESLCRRWMRFSDNGLEDELDDHAENCAACKKRIAKWREAHDVPGSSG